MLLTTLCYLEKDEKYLMLHRVYKKNDVNKEKWLGVGGKFLPGEAPEECLKREVFEETGYILDDYRFRGVMTFVSDCQEPEYIFLYTSAHFHGTPIKCSEGVLEWVPKSEVTRLNIWEGDRIMFRLLNEREDVFSLKLCYEGDRLTDSLEF